MRKKQFAVEIDGRRVLVDQESQEVTVLDGEGRVAFRDRIQVAAGSVQGVFTTALNAGSAGLGAGLDQREVV